MELEWALSSMQPCRGEGGVISAAPLYDHPPHTSTPRARVSANGVSAVVSGKVSGLCVCGIMLGSYVQNK